jgi:flagellar biosynthesis/type III secretory pathway chaperone
MFSAELGRTVTNPQRLRAVLGEQIRCAEAMLETLARESEALADGNHDALRVATDAKATLVDTLERLESERLALAEPNDTTGAADWQRLRELIASCKTQNDRNGTLLKARAENVRIALKALRGTEPELYGASGRTPTRTDARPLGTA